MPEDTDDIALMLRRLTASIASQANERLRRHGLTQSQWRVLSLVAQGQASTPKELAVLLSVDLGAVCRTLYRLEAKQLCRHVRSSEDRRVVRIDVTGRRLQAVASAPAEIAETMNLHLGGFGDTEIAMLRALLTRALANGSRVDGSSSSSLSSGSMAPSASTDAGLRRRRNGGMPPDPAQRGRAFRR